MTELGTLANLAEIESRAEQSRENVYEWFQWLAERLQEQPEFQKGPPAYVARKRWKP